jgi:hypothetical protein
MTREEIIAQFQGRDEVAPTVYTFQGTLSQLQEVANTNIKTFTVNSVLYFVSLDPEYVPADSRMEIL